MSVREAITTAAAIRFRPILMTFLATFLDLMPMAIGIGRGSEANVPLARAVVGGLLDLDVPDAVRRADHVHPFDARGKGHEADIEAELADEPPPALAEQRSAGHALQPAPIVNHDSQNLAPIRAT